MYSLFFKGIIWEHISISLIRVVSGYSIGVLIGFTIGFMMAISRRTDLLLSPIYSFARAIPPIAFVTLFILWFGIGEFSKILLITYGVCMTMIVPTYHGVRDIPAIYIKASKMLGLNGKILFSKVVIPASLPQIFDGLRVALASAWMIIVAAEIMGATEGLGYLLIAGRQFTNVSIIFFGIILIGIMVIIMDLLFKVIRSYVIKWIATY
jgi:ABC-type nitrate/sulfonate/bicarbonate transport system permease component